MQRVDPLIRTKLRLPFTRSALVARSRLQEQVAHGLRGPLTLVTAPAGFGKTTLVASSVEACGLPVAWLSLDKNDNQAGRFLNYLVAALQVADPALGCEAAQLITAAQPAPTEMILTDLINDLDASSREMLLVLDDYQHITSQTVHEAVAFLLEHCPRTFHLLIATRSDPPLPLTRLQGRGQMIELRAADLRFTELEAAQFLNEVMGLNLDAGSVAALAERTEGWIAGLQMAALSMRDREDVSGFIEGFSGTNRYILDYLLEEVLASQPPEVQCFLMCTSILDRLTAPLCDAVLTRTRPPSTVEDGVNSHIIDFPVNVTKFKPSNEILEYLERSNLFLVPMDDERHWYRYHHLFADLLRTRLDLFYPGLSTGLHANAAVWLDREGMTVEAVNHALAAGEYDHAARMVEENTSRLLALGELNALMGWIETLPGELRLSRPWLCIHQATALMFAGRPDESRMLLALAEAGLKEAEALDAALSEQTGITEVPSAVIEEKRQLSGQIASVRSYTAVYLGKDDEALFQGQLARELLPMNDLSNRSVVAWAIGRTLQNQGRLTEARFAFEEHVSLSRASGHIWGLLAGMTALARVLQCQGLLSQARALLEEAIAMACKEGARSRGYIAWVDAGLANVLYEQNELEGAERLLDEAVELTRVWPNDNHLIYAYTLQARVSLARGDHQEARVAILKADQITMSSPLSRWIRYTAEAQLVRVQLAFKTAGVSSVSGDPLAEQSSALLVSWENELRQVYTDAANSKVMPMDEGAQLAALTLARVSLAAGHAGAALFWLEPLTQRTMAAGYIGIPIEALILTAIAQQNQPAGLANVFPALAALEDALSMAQPGGHIRIFLDEGEPIQLLLAQWLAHTSTGSKRAWGPLRDYAIHLLSQFDAEPHAAAAAKGKVSPTGILSSSSGEALVEPLSQRELEVLQLIALGRTNPEIARLLIISPGTVKAHTATIYRKLDVANRTEAVARARQLGILP